MNDTQDKIKVWKCKSCTDQECFSFGIYRKHSEFAPPETCRNNVKPYLEFIWKLTDKYEISERAPSFTMNEDAEKLAATKPELRQKWKGPLPDIARFDIEPDRAKTPNCSLCYWKEEEERPDTDDAGTILLHYVCIAQGFSDCASDDTPGVYNTPECQALYKPIKDHKERFEEWKKKTPTATFIPADFEELPMYINADFRADQQSAQLMAWNAAMEAAK